MTQLTRRSMLAGAVAASTVAPFALRSTVQAAAPAAGKQASGIYRYKIGEFEVTSFNDGFAKVPKLEALRGQQAAGRSREGARSSLHPEGRPARPVQPAVGEHRQESRCCSIRASATMARRRRADCLRTWRPPASIRNRSTPSSSATSTGSISGLRAKAGAANFPNAEIMVPAGEWAYWTDAGEASKTPAGLEGRVRHVKRVFDPIAKDVKQFEFGKELVPGITSVDARGHSPGHAAFLIAPATPS